MRQGSPTVTGTPRADAIPSFEDGAIKGPTPRAFLNPLPLSVLNTRAREIHLRGPGYQSVRGWRCARREDSRRDARVGRALLRPFGSSVGRALFRARAGSRSYTFIDVGGHVEIARLRGPSISITDLARQRHDTTLKAR